MNWQGGKTPECPKDKYFDPFTGNCDPCAPLCAKTFCAHICQDFKLPDVPSDLGAVSSPGGSGAAIVLPLVALFLILVAVVALAFILVRKKCYQKIKDWYIRKTTKLAIQESKNDNDPQTVLFHDCTDM